MNFIEIYFKRPVFWDYILSSLIGVGFYFGIQKEIINYPKGDSIIEIITDISNTSFTSTGFILTILTVLITFKASSKRKKKVKDYDSALDLFFQTPLYGKTTYHLKNCIKSLIFLAMLGYLIKSLIPDDLKNYAFYFVIVGIFILAFTLVRCLLILNKILKLQNI